MDRKELRRVLMLLHKKIVTDTGGVIFRVWFYGSRQKGTHRADSDLDLAIEFIGDVDSDQIEDYWYDFGSAWKNFLSRESGLSVQLVLYEGPQKSPTVHKGLLESSEVIYDSTVQKGATKNPPVKA